MNKKISFISLIVLMAGFSPLQAQPSLEKDYSFVMEIPSMIAMESSPAHLYALSETEGMVVFRAHPDTLQWLYSSAGMEQRGHSMTADVRFAYLYGDSQRLTVLEPTSVLGVYSSTQLPARPLDAKRIDQNLFIALGNEGLGQLSLQSPSSVDSTVEYIELPELQDQQVISLEASSDQLFVLSDGRQLYRFSYDDGGLSLARQFDLSESLNSIFLINDTFYGTNSSGEIYEISGSGNLSSMGSIGEEITQLEAWQDWLIIRGSSNRLWTSYQNRSPELWKNDGEAGNYFTVTKDNLWLSEYDQVSRIISSATSSTATSASRDQTQNGNQSLSLKEIANKTIPHSKQLLFPIQLNSEVPAGTVQFTYQSPNISNAEIRGHSFLWSPSSGDVGSHRVKVIATTSGGETDSTSFSIEVRSFNAPPRFAPVRPVTIPVGEEFTLPISAIDPDGISSELIRFLGVDMPEGASMDEITGEFTWTPNARQVGENEFRVIATDQFGAASSVDVTINVVENPRQNNSGR